jgi:hypothetical protein
LIKVFLKDDVKRQIEIIGDYKTILEDINKKIKFQLFFEEYYKEIFNHHQNFIRICYWIKFLVLIIFIGFKLYLILKYFDKLFRKVMFR